MRDEDARSTFPLGRDAAHAFLWWLSDDRRLGPRSRAAIAAPDNPVYVCAATAWEIALKSAAGKLDAPGDVREWIEQCAFGDLPIEIEHATRSAELPDHHKDPFDRLVFAQAQIEQLTLVAADDMIARYDVALLDATA